MAKYFFIWTGCLIVLGVFVPSLSNLYCSRGVADGFCNVGFGIFAYVIIFFIWFFGSVFLLVRYLISKHNYNSGQPSVVGGQLSRSITPVIVGLVIAALVVLLLGNFLFGLR